MMAQTARMPQQQAPETDASALIGVSEKAGLLSVEIAAVAGIVSDLSALGRTQADRVASTHATVRRMQETNVALSRAMEAARAASDGTRTTLHESAEAIDATVQRTAGALRQLSEATLAIGSSLGGVVATIRNVREAGDAIQNIAREAQILAINAGVEAARAGEAGRGFAIIAAAVRSVADQTRGVAEQSERHLAALAETLQNLTTIVQQNSALATAAAGDADSAGATADTLKKLVHAAGDLTRGIEQMAQPTRSNIDCCEQVRVAFDVLSRDFQETSKQLGAATERSDSILSISEDMIASLARSGLETADSVLIRACQQAALEISARFTQAVDADEISMEDLFDEEYVAIPRTNPQQYVTRFVDFTDRVLPQVQEPMLALDPRVAFCAAVDRNAFLPTHNQKYSQLQGPDPVWNNAHARNRRVFDDRTGSAAAHNVEPFLLQTYRRDMGGGEFAMMKEVDAPILVHGRHWGNVRVGFKP